MNIIGTIKAEKPEKSGVSAKGVEWRSKRYLMSHEMNGSFEKCLAFQVLGDDIDKFGLKVGVKYSIDVDVTAREYNDEWYNTIKAWRVRNVIEDEGTDEKSETKAPEKVESKINNTIVGKLAAESSGEEKKEPRRLDNIDPKELEPKEDDFPF